MLNTRFPIVMILTVVLAYSNVQGQNTMLVNGSFTNTGNSSYIYLTRLFGNKSEVIDSVKHSNGNFSFKTNSPQRGFYKLSASKQGTAVTLVLGEPNLSVKGDLGPNGTFTIDNSKENVVYQAYQQLNENQNKQATALQQLADQLKNKQLPEQEFKLELNKIQIQYDSLLISYSKNSKALIDQNPDLFITKVISMFSGVDETQTENFFTSIDLNDAEICRGDMLPSKISMYFQRFVKPDINNWKEGASTLLSLYPTGTDNKQILYLSLIDMFSPYDQDFTRDLSVAYAKEYPTSSYAQKALANAPKGSLRIGDEAIELALPSPNGKVISLKSLRGKVVLLDFWASWCGPCRQENPNVVNAYNTFKDKGFTVFSVSLDENADKWKAAIAKDGLVWTNHVSDLKGWKSKAAELYNVKGIPMTFLLDKKGVIIATNLRGEALQQKLQELLKE